MAYNRSASSTFEGNFGETREEIRRSDLHREHEDRRIALNSATGGAGPLPAIAVGGLITNIPIVSVTIDAHFDPSVLLTFTTQISLPVALSATLVFTVLRTSAHCGAPIAVGPGVTFSRTVTALTSETFSFQLFDRDLAPGTYTYSVVLAPTTTTTTAGVTLVNATLSAFAVS